MEHRDRFSEMTSSVRVGRCAISTVYFLSAGVRHMTLRSTTSRPGLGPPGRTDAGPVLVSTDPAEPRSDAAALGRAAAVVRLGRDVLDRADLEAGRLERA